jgi:hypothetical protein
MFIITDEDLNRLRSLQTSREALAILDQGKEVEVVAQVEIMSTDMNGYQQDMHVLVELVEANSLPVDTLLYAIKDKKC